jgi:hypothetical protein
MSYGLKGGMPMMVMRRKRNEKNFFFHNKPLNAYDFNPSINSYQPPSKKF